MLPLCVYWRSTLKIAVLDSEFTKITLIKHQAKKLIANMSESIMNSENGNNVFMLSDVKHKLEVSARNINKSEVEPEEDRSSRASFMKNVIAISVGFLFNFTAYSGIANIQSTLNSDKDLGTVSLSVIYASLIVSCMFLPSAFIHRLGCKWTMTISMLLYSTYFAANFHPCWWTLMPSSIMVGLAAAPLWCANCTYLTESGYRYAKIAGQNADVTIGHFFGVFFAIFQTSQVWGNLISSLIFRTTEESFSSDPSICGANYCNQDLSNSEVVNGSSTLKIISEPDVNEMYLLCGTYLACSLFGVLLLALLVNPLGRSLPSNSTPSGLKLNISSLRHMKNPKQLLLIPLTIYSGVEQAYISSDFTKAFVDCSLGFEDVGFVMMCFGTVDAVSSFAVGHLVKFLGRPPLLIFGALLNLALIITMLCWQPNPATPVVFYVIAGLYGMADSIWQTQINALYGLLFNDSVEAAFANYRLWESIGFLITYAYSPFLCINVKLYIIIAILCVGMLGYMSVELTIRGKFDRIMKASSVIKISV